MTTTPSKKNGSGHQLTSRRAFLKTAAADSGTLLVNGCEFREDKPQIELGGQVRRAVIIGNVFTGKPRLTNRSKHSVVFSNNASD